MRVREDKVIDYVDVDTKKKKNYVVFLLIFICFLLVSLIVLLVIYYGNFSKSSSISNTPRIEIQHTDVNTKVVDGIYITDVSEIVENAMPSIVAITSKTLVQSGKFGPSFFGNMENQYTEGAGSGIIISKTNDEVLILTNNHVVADASELTVQFINNKTVDAKIKGVSERKDVAIISVNIKDIDNDTINQIRIATIGNSSDLKVGNGIIAIGNALGYGQSVTTGVISALNRTLSGDNYKNEMIQIDAAINGGNSGGALLNSRGEVVGINSAKYSSSAFSNSASIEGMGFAIPISSVEELINNLMQGKNDEGGMTLGIEGYMTNSGYIQGYNLPSGFYISKIVSGGNADKSSLEIGNIITMIDGKTVDSINVISNILYEKKSGDSVTLKVKYISGREYKEKEVKVNLK